MPTNDPLDELFREALPSVDLPPAPEMDWNAMASLAKGGASTSLWTSAWVKVLGGALAVLIAGYVVVTPSLNDDSDVPAENVRVAYDAATSFNAQDDDSATQLSANNANAPSLEHLSAAAYDTDRAPTTTTYEPREAIEPDVTSVMPSNTLGSRDVGGTTRDAGTLRAQVGLTRNATPAMVDSNVKGIIVQRSSSDLAEVDVPMRNDPRPDLRMELPPALLGSTEALHSRFALEKILPLDLERPGPTPTLLPASPLAKTNGPAFARFGISPWVALGHTIYGGQEGGMDSNALPHLSGPREMVGTVGLRMHYNIDQRAAILLGVQYSNKGSLSGRVPGAGTSYTSYAWSGRFIEVPLSLRYALPLEAKELYVRLGGTMQLNARGGQDRVVQFDADQKQIRTLVFSERSIGAVIDLGVGIQFRLGRGVGLFVEPSYQYALAPVIKSSHFRSLPFNPNVHSLSLGTGLVFQFPHR
ncbi:MAG: hypothetical protein JNM62_11695 [Flavobacteriales bacterium]|nr:hypothetical protein [Flavobacteriales bacterium]